MNLSFQDSLFLILAGSVLIVALVSVLVRGIVLPLLGIKWPSARVKFPWRFSILAVMVLVALAAAIFGILRDSPGAAAAGFGIVLVGWVAVARFVSFCQTLADRRNKQLAATIEERKKQSVEQGKRGSVER